MACITYVIARAVPADPLRFGKRHGEQMVVQPVLNAQVDLLPSPVEEGPHRLQATRTSLP